MKNNISIAFGLCLFWAGLLSQSTARGFAAEPKHNFAAVQAIMQKSCMPCHSESNHAAGLDLSSYKGILKGGRSGPGVVAGKPAKSNLLLYVNGTKKPMMPLRKPALSKEEITTISSWIKSGAKNK